MLLQLVYLNIFRCNTMLNAWHLNLKCIYGYVRFSCFAFEYTKEDIFIYETEMVEHNYYFNCFASKIV